ncbi:MAG: hypothetical protein EU549_02910 [Promethearchaeota archaeon]|nr:MAG: hypothetical protein EU549_02910 [Candidatus Lokiarchaeota archaeon]
MSQNTNIKAVKDFNKIEKALQGLAEIIQFELDEDDFLYLAAMDNLKSLSKNIPKLLEHSQKNCKELVEKFEKFPVPRQEYSKNSKISK